MRRPYLPDLLHFDDLLFSEGRKKTKPNFAIVFFNK